uniref:protein-ribulosamine 3-kinase n=2 Tax=Xenopus tropicalis TaxID=8364 RepID=A0A803J6Y3_XENTR
MEALLRKELDTELLKATGHIGGGCINQGQSYDTDRGRVFVKINHKPEAKQMFLGEMGSLEAILQTGTVRAPKPIKVIDNPAGGAMLVMDHLDIRSLNRHSAKLGEQLADLHLHNRKLRDKLTKESGFVGKGPGQSEIQYVDKFGFDTVTCCGYIPQVNDWQDDWATFFARQRLKPQLDLIAENYGDRAVLSLWAELQIKLHKAFKDTVITPSLLHGDLWEANVAEDDLGPFLFDPGSFYGHSEFDLSIGEMFGAQGRAFFSGYHRKIPKAPGFETRSLLYQLFHSLNNWNHFGPEFRPSSLNLMEAVLDNL